ncbi:MAG: ABC transporter ATP-binding protein [Saprospiraceae bacterium]|nr:ABC transporter ATP-binding protein [Saprospiraceae bacterium]
MTEPETVISVRNLSKTFHVREKPVSSIRDAVLNFTRFRSASHEIKALQNINFEVKKGEIIGVIGRNGSGKSTLLNIILGSMRADKGSELFTKGRIVRLSLGMGFDPNLSARHNIYVNGSILGLTFKKIGLAFADIISFADLEDFVDTPLKYFSSGMRMRLAFSVALHAQADIYLMDEIFGGVGDESFREKSRRVFEDTFLEGRTIIFVSHSLPQIAEFSDKVLLINKGTQVLFDEPDIALAKYREMVANPVMATK